MPLPGARRTYRILSLILGLALLEGGVRVMWGSPPRKLEPQLRLRRHAEYSLFPPINFRGYSLEATVTTGPDGFRHDPFQAITESAPIVALGDSMLFGQGVGDGQTFSSLLNRRGIPYRNLGIPGFDVWQESRLLDKVLSIENPAAVHLHVFANDVLRSAEPGEISPHAGDQGPDGHEWVRRSALLTALGKFWMGHHDPHHPLRRALRSADPPGLNSWESAVEAVSREIISMRDRCRLRGVPFEVCLHPVPFQKPGPDRYQTLLIPKLSAVGIICHDLRGYLAEQDWIPFDGHYSISGHQRLAEAIGALIQSRNLRE